MRVQAYLNRKEGAQTSAAYWYRRCGAVPSFRRPLYTQNTWLLTYDVWNPISGPGYLFR